MTRLTDADIRNQVSPESYRRGEPYFKRGAIQGARRSGRVLRAQCEGSRPEPYRVHVELAPAGIAYAHCSCPVGMDGRCKHIAALLIAWLQQPDGFAEVEDVHVALAEREPEELRAMLHYVMQRHPELELILEMRFPVGEHVGDELDAQAYRDQARDIFREGAQGLGAPSQIADALKPLLEIARSFEARGDALASVRVSGALCDEIIAQRVRVRDEDGFLDAIVVEILDMLFALLGAREISRAARHEALAVLAGAAVTEHLPEVRLHAERGILSSALDDEDRQELALHLRQRLRQGSEDADGSVDSWLLLQLEAAKLEEEAFIQRCRNLGRQDALVEHLLEREQVSEALQEIERADDAHFMALVEAFTTHGHADKVEPVVERRYEEHGELRLLEWLGARYADRGDSALALSTSLARFYRAPTHEALLRIQQLSSDSRQWELLRPSLLANLRARDEWEVVMLCAPQDSMVRSALADGSTSSSTSRAPRAKLAHTSRAVSTGWSPSNSSKNEASRTSRPPRACSPTPSRSRAIITSRSSGTPTSKSCSRATVAFKDCARRSLPSASERGKRRGKQEPPTKKARATSFEVGLAFFVGLSPSNNQRSVINTSSRRASSRGLSSLARARSSVAMAPSLPTIRSAS